MLEIRFLLKGVQTCSILVPTVVRLNPHPCPIVILVDANAVHKDAGTFNVLLPSDVSCGYGSWWVMLNFALTCTFSAHYVDHVA